MDYMSILTELMEKSDEEIRSYFEKMDKSGILKNGEFKLLLLFFIDQKDSIFEINKESADKVNNIINILMFFGAGNMTYIEVMSLMDSSTSNNIKNDNFEIINALEEKTNEAINLKNEGMKTGNIELQIKAKKIHLENIKEWEGLNLSNADGLMRDLYQLAIVSKRLKEFDESEEYLKRYINHYFSSGKESVAYSGKKELGILYLEKEEINYAYETLIECKFFFESKEIMDENELYFIYLNLGKIKLIENIIQEGLTYLIRASFLEPTTRGGAYVSQLVFLFGYCKEYLDYNNILKEALKGENKSIDKLSSRLHGYGVLK